jgi:hypothetical protein
MSQKAISYNYSYEQKELYVLIPENIDVSYYFASDFEISTYISTTYLSIVSQTNILAKIRNVLDQQRRLIRVDFRNDVATKTDTNGVMMDEICVSTFFGEKVHEEMITKIYQHTDCNIINAQSKTDNEIGNKIKGIHDDYNVFRRTFCRKFQHRPKSEEQTTKYNDVRRNNPSSNISDKPPQAKYGAIQVLENYTKTSYTLPNVSSNVGFVYENGLLTVTNGFGRSQHDEIAEYVVKMFDNKMDYQQNKKRKM